MMKKLAIAVVAFMLLAPTLGLVTVGLVTNPAAIACLASSGLTVGNVPDSLVVTTANGETFTLNKQQLTHAATIITVGSTIDGVTRDAIQIALMAALTESTLRQLANTGAYPESGNYPNDGNGSDHDSLGLFQMRPQSGWGSVAELMDPEYQAKAFFGGPTGPNYPSPRGLLDVPGWQGMGKGEVAQAVEVSAYPDRYNNYEPSPRRSSRRSLAAHRPQRRRRLPLRRPSSTWRRLRELCSRCLKEPGCTPVTSAHVPIPSPERAPSTAARTSPRRMGHRSSPRLTVSSRSPSSREATAASS